MSSSFGDASRPYGALLQQLAVSSAALPIALVQDDLDVLLSLKSPA
jgi:hypothetical protein